MILLLFFLFLIIYITHLPATSSSLFPRIFSHFQPIVNLYFYSTYIRLPFFYPLFLSVKLFNFSSTFPPLPPVSFTTHSSHLYIPHSTLSPFPFHPSFSNPSSAIPSSTAYTHPLLIFHASSHPAASSLFFARSLLLLLPRHLLSPTCLLILFPVSFSLYPLLVLSAVHIGSPLRNSFTERLRSPRDFPPPFSPSLLLPSFPSSLQPVPGAQIGR